MTRGEALKIAEYRDCQSLVERIYDDIESRVCENCKYWSQEYVNLGICLKEVDTERIDDLSDWCTVGNFGCNRFERKLESK